MTTKRQSQVEALFASEGLVTISHLTTLVWDAAAPSDPTGKHRPFGFVPPRKLARGWVMWLCPEIIAEQTKAFDDEEFTDYVLALCFRCHIWVTSMHEGVSESEAVKRADQILQDEGPATYDMIQVIEMEAAMTLDYAG